MALTVEQAGDINTLCNFLCRPAMRETSASDAREALARLAGHAEGKLPAGYGAEMVREGWADAGIVDGLQKFCAELGQFCDTNGADHEVILRWDGTADLMEDDGSSEAFKSVGVFPSVEALWEHLTGE